MEPMSHAQRIADLVARLDEAAARFLARLEGAGGRAEAAPATGWTVAQIGAHVALVNDNFTSVIDGSNPAAVPAPEGFVERPWSEIAAGIPARIQAVARFEPPPVVTAAEAAARVRESTARLRAAVAALTPERARWCFPSRIAGTVSVYHAGEWAVAHIIRHNQQAKRLLAEGRSVT